MKINTVENIIENLFYVLPVIHKKLLKVESPEINPPVALSPVQVAVMGIIKDEGLLSISEIARRLLIPKPQMTHVVNRMVNSGVVERRPSRDDRRVINVGLTASGIITAKQIEEFLKNNVRKNLSYLTENELEELSLLLLKLRELGSRL
jgi:MarR family 2-MHQ and catechol resistance regulon transcriptional repressor